MPLAIQVLQGLVKDSKISGKSKVDAIKKMDEVFGLDLLKKEKLDISKEVKDLVKQREKARKDKDWKLSDDLRDQISDLGFQVNDTKDGTDIIRK